MLSESWVDGTHSACNARAASSDGETSLEGRGRVDLMEPLGVSFWPDPVVLGFYSDGVCF